MKEKYISPVIEVEELAKADVLCGSFDEGNDNINIDGDDIYVLG